MCLCALSLCVTVFVCCCAVDMLALGGAVALRGACAALHRAARPSLGAAAYATATAVGAGRVGGGAGQRRHAVPSQQQQQQQRRGIAEVVAPSRQGASVSGMAGGLPGGASHHAHVHTPSSSA